jgi:hypothetical protein
MPDPRPIHDWEQLTPTEVLAALPHELYHHVSALGSDLDTLSNGAFPDDELPDLIQRLRDSVSALGRVVVAVKRYNDTH